MPTPKDEIAFAHFAFFTLWQTHSHLLKKEEPPLCHVCDSHYTVQDNEYMKNVQIFHIPKIDSQVAWSPLFLKKISHSKITGCIK